MIKNRISEKSILEINKHYKELEYDIYKGGYIDNDSNRECYMEYEEYEYEDSNNGHIISLINGQFIKNYIPNHLIHTFIYYGIEYTRLQLINDNVLEIYLNDNNIAIKKINYLQIISKNLKSLHLSSYIKNITISCSKQTLGLEYLIDENIDVILY